MKCRFDIFARTPGARPAVIGGLVNGVAIGTPLLVGAAAGEPAAGATACIGAYIAAFTNKGGRRRSRTSGLLMAAFINTVAFAAGAVTTRWFPLDMALFAALVFIASMGAAFGRTAVRCGTMPATAFLVGIFTSCGECGGVGLTRRRRRAVVRRRDDRVDSDAATAQTPGDYRHGL